VKIRMSVALEPDLDERVRESADRSGKTLSTWITEAVKAKLLAELGLLAELQRKMRGLDRFLEEWQAEHGYFTDEEMAETSREMGLPWPPAPKEGQA
jgi:predicted transcriptional regulator